MLYKYGKHLSGQIIATSHDLTPNGGLVREISLFQGNLGWWNIIIWPDLCHYKCIKYIWMDSEVQEGWKGETAANVWCYLCGNMPRSLLQQLLQSRFPRQKMNDLLEYGSNMEPCRFFRKNRQHTCFYLHLYFGMVYVDIGWYIYIYMDTIEANMVSIICTKPKVRGAHLSWFLIRAFQPAVWMPVWVMRIELDAI